MNVLSNGDLELPVPPPTLGPVAGVASRTDAYPVHGGAWALLLSATAPGVPTPRQGTAVWSIPVVSGRLYEISLWASDQFAVGSGVLLEALVDKGDGVFLSPGVAPPQIADYSHWNLGTFVAAGSTARVQFRALFGTLFGSWLLDDVVCDDMEDRLRKQIREKLLLKLQGINTGAGYLTNPQTVKETWFPPRAELVEVFPALFLVPVRSENDNPEGTAMGQRTREVTFSVVMVVKDEDETPDASEDLLADVFKALETDQTLSGLNPEGSSGRYPVEVDSDDPYETTPDVARGIRSRWCSVTVTYQAPLGTI